MGFNRRKMEAQRAAAAEKKAAAKRATEAQILEDAGRLISKCACCNDGGGTAFQLGVTVFQRV